MAMTVAETEVVWKGARTRSLMMGFEPASGQTAKLLRARGGQVGDIYYAMVYPPLGTP